MTSRTRQIDSVAWVPGVHTFSMDDLNTAYKLIVRAQPGTATPVLLNQIRKHKYSAIAIVDEFLFSL